MTMHDGERQVAPTLSGIRRDHVARYEFAARALKPGSRVIDFACGVGYGAKILADAGHVVHAFDVSEEALAYAREHFNHPLITYRKGDGYHPGELGEFDAAVCFETIEHLKNPLTLLEALRASAHELLCSVPNEAVFPHRGRVKHHYRHYTQQQLEDLLASAGFGVTAWHGQAGPESEVEPGAGGRTLIALAHPVMIPERAVLEPLQVAPPAAAPDHVTIVGLGPTCATFFELTRRLGGVSAYCDEVWGINAIGDVMRCDRVFHMDDVRIQEARAEARPDSNIASMLRWLKKHPGPVYTSVVREGYPGLVAFPLQDVLNGRLDGNGGAPYFNSTAAYAIAYAVHIGVKRISLFGLDYTLPNAHQAEKGRACCEFWLGIAAARGIEVTIPDNTSLMDACEQERDRLYGYDCVDVHLEDDETGVRVRFTERADIPTAAAVEARYDHRKHPNPLMEKTA